MLGPFPDCARCEHNIVADGLALWSERGFADAPSQEEMVRTNPSDDLWAIRPPPYNTTPLAQTSPCTFAMLAATPHFHQIRRNYRVCEWRPSNFAPDGRLGDGAFPFSATKSLKGVCTI